MEDIIRLQEIGVSLSSAPHKDIPDGSKLSAQIIIDQIVFAQTIPVDRVENQSDCWKLILEFNLPPSVEYFSIAILRENPANITRLLGILEISRAEILTEGQNGQLIELSLPLVKVNDDGPLLITALFLILSSVQQLPFQSDHVVQFEDICGIEDLSLDPKLDSIEQVLTQMKEQEEQINALQISIMHERLLLAPSDKTKAKLLNDLGDICSKHQQSREVDDLHRAVGIYDDAVREGPDEFTYRNDLGLCLKHCFERLGDLCYLNRSIEVHEAGILLVKNHNKLHGLGNLGDSLLSRFEQLGGLSDLNRSIQIFEDAILLTPDGNANRPAGLSNLSISLKHRFERVGDITDLDRSVQLIESASLLAPTGDLGKPGCLSNLGISLACRFQQLGDISDISKSIQVIGDAILLTPDEHPDKPTHLNNLGVSLKHRFERFGDLSDLRRSIQVFEDAILLTPDGHPDKSMHLNNLGTVFPTQTGCCLAYNEHTDKAAWLSNLGISLLDCFKHFGDLSNLNRSIQVIEDAILLIPDGHFEKPAYLTNLGNSLRVRFEHLGDLSDLNRAIQVKEDAVLLTPSEHPDKPIYLSNLGNSLLHRFKRVGDLSDLNRSVQVLEDAILLIPNGHPEKFIDYNNLGNSLLVRFEQLGDLSDINRSIQIHEDAILHIPNGHPAKASCLNNLGYSFMRRFEQQAHHSNLNRSIQLKQDVILLTPNEHPDRASHLNNLGNSLSHRFNSYNDPQDLHAAISNYSAAAQSVVGPCNVKFTAARSWAKYAGSHLPGQAIESYTVAMNLIPELTWLGSPISERHYQVMKAGSIARDAAATAIVAHQYVTAVEWLEQGRSVIWSQLLQLRSPVDQLRQVKPKFADRLQLVSIQLESADIAGSSPEKLDYHNLADERDKLLKEIRQLVGFERFLLHKTFSQLLPAANGGPIIVLNVSEVRCDALVLTRDHDDVLHVPLELTLKEASAWSGILRMILIRPSLSLADMRTQKGVRQPDPGMAIDREAALGYMLQDIWHRVVEPILNALAITKSMESGSDVRRIWWCLTGPLSFLPIHAAGIYPDGPKLSDFAVSSYTPTLDTLLDKPHTQPEPAQHQLLIVALPCESQLPGTAKEVERVVKHAESFRVLTLIESEATVQHVSEAMKSSSWVHFACHGTQDTTNPSDSCLLLASHSKLTLSKIIKLQLENAELAFLSACQTATGDEELQDEAVHLAAGMILAGYRSVIATMWIIDDDIAVEVADEAYRRLFTEYRADPRRAAEALHFAVKTVRQSREAKGKVSLFSWVPFIHMGI